MGVNLGRSSRLTLHSTIPCRRDAAPTPVSPRDDPTPKFTDHTTRSHKKCVRSPRTYIEYGKFFLRTPNKQKCSSRMRRTNRVYSYKQTRIKVASGIASIFKRENHRPNWCVRLINILIKCKQVSCVQSMSRLFTSNRFQTVPGQ